MSSFLPHLATASTGLVLALAVSGCINREGTFAGEYTATSKLSKDGTALAATGPKPITVEMKSAGSGLSADVDGCPLKFSEAGTAEVTVDKGQTCELSVKGYQGTFSMAGTGGVNRNSALLGLQLVATPTDSALSGTLELSFSGNRK